MEDAELIARLKDLKRTQRASLFLLGAMVALLLLAFGLIILLILPIREAERIRIEANPMNQNSNSVTVADPLAAIEARGKRQGFYSKAQFSDLMGFSVRTLERRIRADLLEPPARVTDSGDVRISLETTIRRDAPLSDQ